VRRLKIAAVAATAAEDVSPAIIPVDAASRLPQSLRLRQLAWSQRALEKRCRLKIAAVAATAATDVNFGNPFTNIRLKIAAVAATAARAVAEEAEGVLPPQDCRSRGDCGRLNILISFVSALPPQDCRSRGDCGAAHFGLALRDSRPPQDCRSRGDCGETVVDQDARGYAASRLPQSRRLRLSSVNTDLLVI